VDCSAAVTALLFLFSFLFFPVSQNVEDSCSGSTIRVGSIASYRELGLRKNETANQTWE